MSTTTPIFTAGGLASGLDTNTIVDKLVALESQPITDNNTKQAALNVQISAIGDLSSKIQSLAAAATTLSGGVSANSVTSVPSGITAVTGTGALPGTYAITVSSVASSAKARSDSFASPNSTVPGGQLELHIQGVDTKISIAANSDLGSVVRQINQSGAGVSAAVVSDGTRFYVSLTNRSTGKPIGGAADSGLKVDSDPTGLNLAVTQNATNALVKVDDLNVESQTNDISTAIPGVTITVNSQQPVAGNLVIASNPTTSTSNIQSFVNAYNAIVTAMQPSLRPDPTATLSPGSKLDGSTVLSLQSGLQNLLSSQVVSGGSVRTLSDLGIDLQNDGTLQLDTAAFTKALANDPGAVDAIFSTATTGMGDEVANLAKRFTDPLDGQLVQRTTSLQKTIKDITAANVQLQTHVDNYKQQLETQFANMESIIANYNSIGTFLTNSATAASQNATK